MFLSGNYIPHPLCVFRSGIHLSDSRQRGGGESILRRLQCHHLAGPVLRASDVSDFGQVGFVADPFLYVEENGTLNLFFEVFNSNKEPTAVIGHAESPDRGYSWSYTGVVLECARHASYPFVFGAKGDIYLIPGLASTHDSPAPAKLFRAKSFPHDWELENVIVETDHPCIDTTVFRYRDVWWALVGAGRNDELHLYYSDSLLVDNWTAHPENPVVEDRPSAGRPGGRPINTANRLLMPLQDCIPQYGDALRVYEITKLSKEAYADSPLLAEPVLSGAGGLGWNSGRMHHLDL